MDKEDKGNPLNQWEVDKCQVPSEDKKGINEKRKEQFSSFWRGNPVMEEKMDF